MYTVARMLPRRELVARHIPTLGVSVLVAELFYKFHSFTIECLAFLATWFVLDAVVSALCERVGVRHGRAQKQVSPS